MSLLPCLALATGAEYKSSVQWVKEHSPTNSAVVQQPLYVANVPGEPPASASIMSFTNGITLRAVLDQTRYKGTAVFVMILRAEKPTVFVFDRLVNASESPDFKLLPGDLILLARGDKPLGK